MAAVAGNPAFAKKAGVPQSVGEEFIKADKGRKFARGGEMKESKAMMKKEIGFMKKAGMKKMASGGLAAGHKAADGIAKKGKTRAMQVKMAGGGKC